MIKNHQFYVLLLLTITLMVNSQKLESKSFLKVHFHYLSLNVCKISKQTYQIYIQLFEYISFNSGYFLSMHTLKFSMSAEFICDVGTCNLRPTC